jgi:hypothetical protein
MIGNLYIFFKKNQKNGNCKIIKNLIEALIFWHKKSYEYREKRSDTLRKKKDILLKVE